VADPGVLTGRHLMRLVADENITMKAVLLLREKGHGVISISESLPQTADEQIYWPSLRMKPVFHKMRDFIKSRILLSPKCLAACDIERSLFFAYDRR